jgi:hypothetical protein
MVDTVDNRIDGKAGQRVVDRRAARGTGIASTAVGGFPVIRIVALLLLLSHLGGCVTPVIPLPPPRVEDMSFAVSGSARNLVALAGPANPSYVSHYVFVLNLRTGKGLIAATSSVDGSFNTDPFEALDKDRLDIWIARGPDDSTSGIACGILDFPSGRLTDCAGYR